MARNLSRCYCGTHSGETATLAAAIGADSAAHFAAALAHAPITADNTPTASAALASALVAAPMAANSCVTAPLLRTMPLH